MTIQNDHTLKNTTQFDCHCFKSKLNCCLSRCSAFGWAPYCNYLFNQLWVQVYYNMQPTFSNVSTKSDNSCPLLDYYSTLIKKLSLPWYDLILHSLYNLYQQKSIKCLPQWHAVPQWNENKQEALCKTVNRPNKISNTLILTTLTLTSSNQIIKQTHISTFP